MRNLHFKLPPDSQSHTQLNWLAIYRNSIEKLSGHPNGQDAFSIHLHSHIFFEVDYGVIRCGGLKLTNHFCIFGTRFEAQNSIFVFGRRSSLKQHSLENWFMFTVTLWLLSKFYIRITITPCCCCGLLGLAL
jgi:hypothetical protein